jgi:hypothetical protein
MRKVGREDSRGVYFLCLFFLTFFLFVCYFLSEKGLRVKNSGMRIFSLARTAVKIPLKVL